MSASAPFVQTSTPNIERANRLISLRDNPGFFDLLRLSQELVQSAADICADYGGWDAQQIMVLKVRMQTAKEHHQMLIAKIQEAIKVGIEEGLANAPTLPEKSPEQIMEHGDFVRQAVLQKFDEVDTRSPGSY